MSGDSRRDVRHTSNDSSQQPMFDALRFQQNERTERHARTRNDIRTQLQSNPTQFEALWNEQVRRYAQELVHQDTQLGLRITNELHSIGQTYQSKLALIDAQYNSRQINQAEYNNQRLEARVNFHANRMERLESIEDENE
jgi:hypothetical protein